MKRWIALFLVSLSCGFAVILSERRKPAAPVGPQAVLSMVADTQRELTRLPAAFTRLSDDDEIKIGDELATYYLRLSPFKQHDADTKTVESYVSRVGARVSAGAHRKLAYRFHYVSDPGFVNAFALPGGHVLIGNGLIALMDSEDELADILGHEVEHIDHYHCIERAQSETTLRKLPLGELVGIPVEVFEAGYSKAQELEADREGTRLAVKAGYSPLGAIRMFQIFDQLQRRYQGRSARAQSPEEELSQIAIETLEGYFRSHPLPSERIDQIQRMVVDENWESRTIEQPLAVAYVFMTQRAVKALAAKNFAGAERVAAKSLALQPNQPDALEVLAAAQFAQMKFAAAGENYHKLIGLSPSDSADFARFAISVGYEAKGAEHFDQAAQLASALLQLQPNNSAALVLLAESQIALSKYTDAITTYRKLYELYPDDASNVPDYARALAEKSMSAHHYQQAAGIARCWLAIEPRQEAALRIQASAGLALGDFAAAAKADRSLLDLTPKDQEVDLDEVWSYAEALSAADNPKAAVRVFQGFAAHPRRTTAALEAEIKIEWAGLDLLAGNGVPAQRLAASAGQGAQSKIAPEALERLGWWYYRAGRYAEAEALLTTLAGQRSADVQMQYDRGWIELERGNWDSAIARFGVAPDATVSQERWNSPLMGRAIALWNLRRSDEAISSYRSAIEAEPRWTNPRIVGAFYSLRAAKSVAELEAENSRRLQARR